ncbi:MAG: HAD-IA family hydrolase [Caulobacteraceae bacterium]|nr:HAD-IA family hydrolase [Caulobacteraceae bacterium]
MTSLLSSPAAVLTGATVAFDLDGTLVDTAPDLIGALNAVLREQSLPALPLATARVMVGRGARALIEQGFAAAGEPLGADDTPALVERFIEVYRGRIALESRPFDGVEAALDCLAAAGATLAVCTNKRTDLSLALLDALGLTARFAAVVGADRAPAPKPDARHLLTAVAEAGGRIERAILVGDSASDVGAARAAGAPSVVVGFGYTEIAPAELGGDHLIAHFAELPALATRLLARPA